MFPSTAGTNNERCCDYRQISVSSRRLFPTNPFSTACLYIYEQGVSNPKAARQEIAVFRYRSPIPVESEHDVLNPDFGKVHKLAIEPKTLRHCLDLGIDLHPLPGCLISAIHRKITVEGITDL